jgi:hypothetical protein
MGAWRMTWLSDPDRSRKLAFIVLAGLAGGAIFCLVAMTLDWRTLPSGEDVWLKPLRFCLAFALHLATILWIGRYARLEGKSLVLYSTGTSLQSAVVCIEMACIVTQAMRGVPSHFNYTTPFDRAIFTIMGLGTAVVLAGVALCAWSVRQSTLPGAKKRLLLGGFVLAILGGLVGVVMVMPTPEQRAALGLGVKLAWVGGAVVGTPSGALLPFFHWDLRSGDWRAVHFLGLHGLQALPLLAWLCQPDRRWHAGLAIAGATTYAALFLWAVARTAAGQSLLTPGGGSFWIAPGLMLLFAIAVIAMVPKRA